MFLQDATNLSNDELNNLKDKFPEAKDKIHELADKLREKDNDDSIDELLDMMINNWENQSDFVQVQLKFKIIDYFHGPIMVQQQHHFIQYSVYGLEHYWFSIVGTRAPEFEDGAKIRPYEMYLGKLLLFINCRNMSSNCCKFRSFTYIEKLCSSSSNDIFYSVFVSVVFVIIIYTAASILDACWKRNYVVLLVLQMAGASGNFPIEVTPILFQKIYPFLPFTYAISGMRQIMAGIVYKILFKDMAILCVFMQLFH